MMKRMNDVEEFDPEIAQVIKDEMKRQEEGAEMIASENFVSRAVMQTMGTVLTNKYSEGYPNRRYYSGNKFIDKSESLAIERAKKLFNCDHANVQSHSGSSANASVYLALLQPGDTILGMSLDHGGHLTHGSKVNFSGKYFNFIHYGVKDDGYIDMEEVEKMAMEHKPKMILAGFSAYSRTLDFPRFKEIADKCGAYLMSDIAHIAGLIAAKVLPSPFPYCDVVTTTTHKTLRGPRGAMILCKEEFKKKIDSAVFPGSQGGPLDHVIAAKAVAFKEALMPEFKVYQEQVVKNAKILSETLIENGINVVSGGTDNHLVLIDISSLDLGGKVAENALDEVMIYTNKNMIPNDKRSPFDPSGIRVGTPALTTRGLKEEEMKLIATYIAETLKNHDDEEKKTEIKSKVKELISNFPLYPGLSILK